MDQRVLRILEYQKITEKLQSKCCSRMTMEEVKGLLPSSDIKKVAYELQKTDEAVQVLLKKGAPPLGNFYDISGIVHLASKEGVLTMRQLLEVNYNLRSARLVKEYLGSDLPPLQFIDNMTQSISVIKPLEDEISRCILSEDEIADSASPQLQRIRRDIVKKNDAIKQKIQQIMGSSAAEGILQDALITMREGRYVVPVKSENKSKLPGIVHDQSSSGATLFIEPAAIVQLNNDLRELEIAEKEEIAKILKDLSLRVGGCEHSIIANQDILFKLDLAFAKGRLACDMRAMKPCLSDDGRLELKKARHPLLDEKKAVPIDIALGGEYDTLIVTGPNTGGKTVTLKTAGLLCLMAQAGLFIPASDGSTVPVYKGIYADIGDEQSIEQSLSTFSSHMVNIVEIVKKCGPKSLVLFDELGAGTDPAEGAALAMAILDSVYAKGAQTIATTHYTELKKYAVSTSGVQNASMEFDVETLSPTYRLITGVPGKSNAFEISKRLGLSDDVIQRAKGLLEEGDIAFEDVLSSIESDRKNAQAEKAEAMSIAEQMHLQKARMDELEQKYEQKKAQLIEDAKAEAKEIVDEARRSVEEMQKELAALRGRIDDEAVAAAERDLNKAFESAKKDLRQKSAGYAPKKRRAVNYDSPSAEDIIPGGRVNVISFDQKAQILTKPDEKGDFFVQMGSIKVGVNVKDVTLVAENRTEKERQKIRYSQLVSQKVMSVLPSVNVIGQNLDEAEANVEKYLDDAYMAGLDIVTIVHGKGTGVLRSGIRSMLKKNKNVKEYRSGGLGEGGDGATVVVMKK